MRRTVADAYVGSQYLQANNEKYHVRDVTGSLRKVPEAHGVSRRCITTGSDDASRDIAEQKRWCLVVVSPDVVTNRKRVY